MKKSTLRHLPPPAIARTATMFISQGAWACEMPQVGGYDAVGCLDDRLTANTPLSIKLAKRLFLYAMMVLIVLIKAWQKWNKMARLFISINRLGEWINPLAVKNKTLKDIHQITS